ncbi:Protein TolB [Fundidesulfovibrio magnetotacticus]|uniref:Protein TolB n=1 Tax=Fundidesulfovibrio magnetotacticus TaxID=2730080 RepID=A0A6V8LUI0_9BACT|nr:WD40 repeat domain-containing protein [Fundidesulfovibrio magnetotacticus]GFK94610.1 Protein TolB [Fundidesulfovibrio magnetotacticus]
MSAPENLSPGLWQWSTGAFAERVAFSADAGSLAVALGDGRLGVVSLPSGTMEYFPVHRGSCLSVAAHPAGGWITGGDDGVLAYVDAKGAAEQIALASGCWLEHMAASRAGDMLAVAAGRNVLALDLHAGSMATLGPHPGAVLGLCVSPAGGVLAATHAGGFTLWDLQEAQTPTRLDLQGMNIAPAFSPDGSYLALGHQENTIHVVDLESRKVFQLGGLPARPGRLAWSHDGGLLLHTGTKAVLGWPVPGCFAPNPAPVAFAVQPEARMTALDANPRIPFAACGFADGTLLLAELKRMAAHPLDLEPLAPATCALWSPQGLHLACAFEDGRVALLDLRAFLAQG